MSDRYGRRPFFMLLFLSFAIPPGASGVCTPHKHYLLVLLERWRIADRECQVIFSLAISANQVAVLHWEPADCHVIVGLSDLSPCGTFV